MSCCLRAEQETGGEFVDATCWFLGLRPSRAATVFVEMTEDEGTDMGLEFGITGLDRPPGFWVI